MAVLIFGPRIYVADENGEPIVGARLYTLATGTSTPVTTYANAAATVPHANPILSLAGGYFPAIYAKPSLGALKFRLFSYDPLTLTETNLGIDTDPAYSPLTVTDLITTSNDLAQLLESLDITEAETASNVTPTHFAFGTVPYDVRRVGIEAGGDATLNTAALQALFDPTVTGITGPVVFPNASGADVYDFNDIAQLRDGLRLDLCGSTLKFSKTHAASDDLMGFLTFIRDVAIENGNIVIDYDGTGGTNAGCVMRIGSRNGYPFGSNPAGIQDEDLTVPMGNIQIRNLRITTNNPVGAAVMMLGGLENVTFENVWIDGQNAAIKGIYYEFGHYHYEATAANILSSHAINLNFRNIHIKDLNTASGLGFSLVGALSAKVTGLHVDGVFNGAVFRSGEALYYNKGTPYTAVRQRILLENINVKNAASNGIYLQGAESASGGYLATFISGLAAADGYAAQTDRLYFDLNGFTANADGVGLRVSGPATIRNGRADGAAASGQCIIDDECVSAVFTNVELLNSSNVGVRAAFGGAIWSPTRQKILQFHNCRIAGNTGAGISINNSASVLISNCRLGYNTAYDPAAEATQTAGVSLGSAASGVMCVDNYTSVSSGAAYISSNAATNAGNFIRNEQNTKTVSGSGHWVTDFQSSVAQAISNASTISCEGLTAIRCTAAAACTGVILQAGYFSGQMITVFNESANTITFAASGTSHVADGTSDVIAGLTAATYVYNTGTSLWYRV